MSFVSDYLEKINKYCCRKYVLDDVHFTRKRKIGMDDLILHLITNKNRANVVECLSFYKELKQDDFVTITLKLLVKNDNIWIQEYLLI